MVPFRYRALTWAVLWTVPAALLTRASLPAAAAWAALGVLFATTTRWPGRRGGLCALPVVLAGITPRELPPPPLRAGPVHVRGQVGDVVRAPLDDRSYVYLTAGPRLTFPGDVDCVPGDRIELLARRGPPAIPGLAPTLTGIPATMRVRAGPWSWRRLCGRLRRALERQLLRLVPGESGALLATLVLGRGTRADRDLAEAHRATGLSHLLAVSGAHAAMLAFLLGLSGRGRQLGASRLRSSAVLALLVLYGGTAGAEPPVLRAVLAFALATLAARTGRSFGTATGLLAPAVLTCLVEPAAFAGPSFLLSYAAVTGLALAMPKRPADGALGLLALALSTSFWATLMTAPLTLGFFDQLAPLTIVLTPLLAPLVAVMLLLGLVTAALGTFATVPALLLAWPLSGLADCYAWLVLQADTLPGTPVPAWFRPPLWALALVAAAGVAAVLARPRRRTVACAVAALASLWFVPLGPAPAPGFALLAVGHGQAALVHTAAGAQVAIDCGSLQGGFLAARALDEALDRRTLDLLVVTHGDRDHTNGIVLLLSRLRIRRALLPARLADGELAKRLCAEGVDVVAIADGAVVEPLPGISVLAPLVPPASSSNDRSLWVRARVGDARLLLTGDAQEAGTDAVLKTRFADDCEFLVLPHHGRPHADAERLLQRCRPRVCLASAATVDGATALGALVRRVGAELWVTGLHGSLHVPADTLAVAVSGPGTAARASGRPRTPPPDRGRPR